MKKEFKALNKVYVVAVKLEDGTSVFYRNTTTDKDDKRYTELVGIRSKAYHFDYKENADLCANLLGVFGYDASVEEFYKINLEK